MLLAVARRLSSIFSLTIVALLVAASIWATINVVRMSREVAKRADAMPAPVGSGQFLTTGSIDKTPPPAMKPKSESKPEPRTDNVTLVHAGDRLALMFYEKLAVDDEEKWAARFQGRRPAVNFHQRGELTGVYEVQDNGLVVIPLLGSFNAKDRTLAQLEVDIVPVFERLIGRFAFMSATIEQKPVYLLGPIEKPGVYKYSPGMTVFHLLAMAGGVDRRAVSFERVINAVDQTERKQKSAELLKRALARSAALISERDGRPIEIPDMLLKLAGASEAKALIDAELAARKPQEVSRREQDTALVAAETSASAELEHMKVRRAHIEESIKLRAARVDDLKTLNQAVSRSVLIQASAELMDARERLADSQIATKQTENKIAQIAKERGKLRSDQRIEVERDILAVNTQITEFSISLHASENATDVLSGALNYRADSGDVDLHYEIVRRTKDGEQVLNVAGTEEVLPGDLVRIKTGARTLMLESAAGMQPNQGPVAPIKR